MIGQRSQLINFVSKFMGTVRFGNDQVATIIGFGDYQTGNVTISRVYYVEGLGHNLFSVDQFCNFDLEIAFRKHTYFVRDFRAVSNLQYSSPPRETDVILKELPGRDISGSSQKDSPGESEDQLEEGRTLGRSESKRQKSSIEEDDLSQPWGCEGAPKCLKISGFIAWMSHNPELSNEFNDKIPKSVDEMMRVTTSFLRGEVTASNHEQKKSLLSWKQQEAELQKGGF
ncbi:hypothetical protein Tco_0168866 [Tanacetum coccineum]